MSSWLSGSGEMVLAIVVVLGLVDQFLRGCAIRSSRAAVYEMHRRRRSRKAFWILVLGLFIGLLMVKFVVDSPNRAY